MSAAIAPETRPVAYSLSKSAARATGCELFFRRRFIDREGPRLRPSRGAEITAEFTVYRTEYVRRLVELGQESAPDDIWDWIQTQAFHPDTIELITHDVERFRIKPETVVATEILLSVDSQFQPLEYLEDATQAAVTNNLIAYAHGVLDLVCVENRTAKIADYRTGWSQEVDDYEAVHYAVLVFAHFPYVEMVEFTWDWIRSVKDAPLTFHRAFFPQLQDAVRARAAQRDRLFDRAVRGVEPAVDPTAGLCHWCPYRCPLREQITKPLLDHEPLQDEAAAAAFAERLYLAQEYVSRGRQLLKSYLDTAPGGLVRGRNGIIAQMRPEVMTSYPLDRVLLELGLYSEEDLPSRSKRWDIGLDSLQVRTTGLHQKAKAKKRAGLMEALEQIADRKPRFELVIRRKGSAEGGDGRAATE